MKMLTDAACISDFLLFQTTITRTEKSPDLVAAGRGCCVAHVFFTFVDVLKSEQLNE